MYVDPILYIIVDTEMASMTPGRVSAQTAHAHGVMEQYLSQKATVTSRAWSDWKSDRGFGTTIVLEPSEYMSFGAIKGALNLWDHVLTVKSVVDPTYPLKDGKVIHYVPVETVLAVFLVDRNKCPDIIKELPLYGG